MFQLKVEEWENLKSQFSMVGFWGGRRHPPFAFTEHGVLMLSSVLNSERAMRVNIQIVRLFIKMREIILTHKDLLLKIEQIEKKVLNHDGKVQLLFDYLNKFMKKIPRKVV